MENAERFFFFSQLFVKINLHIFKTFGKLKANWRKWSSFQITDKILYHKGFYIVQMMQVINIMIENIN